MSGTKVAIAGATGNLGPSILNALLNANFSVTVLSRKGGSSNKLPKHANITLKEVDYSSVDSLTPALQGIEAVVSVLASEAVGAQNPLIDAAVAAGVKRFIPSEFGSNTINPQTAQLPVFAGKVATQQYLKEIAAKKPDFTYTFLVNGPFLDWGIQAGFVINAKGHSATVYNGGDVPFSATNLSTIADAVVAIIKKQPETANKALYIHDTLTTQNKLIQYAKEKDGKDFSITHKDTEEIRQSGLKALQSGKAENLGEIFVGFIYSAIFQEGYGGNFSEVLSNDLLGIKELSEEELKKLVQSFLPSSKSLL